MLQRGRWAEPKRLRRMTYVRLIKTIPASRRPSTRCQRTPSPKPLNADWLRCGRKDVVRPFRPRKRDRKRRARRDSPAVRLPRLRWEPTAASDTSGETQTASCPRTTRRLPFLLTLLWPSRYNYPSR